MPAPLLAIENLHKSFNVPVLTGVDFTVQAGEVHALMGANGAGKSTLSNIICGHLQPTSGGLTLAGAAYAPGSVSAAEALGVRMVMQELNQINNLTVGENICLRHLPRRFGFVQFKRVKEIAEAALALVGLDDLNPATPMHTLGVGQQQLVEIATTISQPCKLLILDEPTAALTEPQIEKLFAQIRRLQSAGTGIIYISHRMADIEQIADTITVLRDGKSVATKPCRELSVDQIVAHMTGEAVGQHAEFPRRPTGELALSVRQLCRPPLLKNIDLEVYQGEILGIAGLIGAGRTELLRAIYGADAANSGDSGTMSLGHRQEPFAANSPAQAVRSGVGLIPEDRKQQALLLTQAIAHNISLANLGQLTRACVFIDNNAEITAAQQYQQQLAIKCDGVNQLVGQLSGGNQQKAVIARWLLRDCTILLFDEPTRGIDIQTKRMIYQLLDQLAKAGKAIVVVSSETDELTTLCDRIAVMSNGEISATFERGQWSAEKIMAAACQHFLQTKPKVELAN